MCFCYFFSQYTSPMCNPSTCSVKALCFVSWNCHSAFTYVIRRKKANRGSRSTTRNDGFLCMSMKNKKALHVPFLCHSRIFVFSEKSDASFSSRLNKCHRSNFVSIGNSREHVWNVNTRWKTPSPHVHACTRIRRSLFFLFFLFFFPSTDVSPNRVRRIASLSLSNG